MILFLRHAGQWGICLCMSNCPRVSWVLCKLIWAMVEVATQGLLSFPLSVKLLVYSFLDPEPRLAFGFFSERLGQSIHAGLGCGVTNGFFVNASYPVIKCALAETIN